MCLPPPDRLSAVSGPQERVQRYTVEQMGDCVPGLPALDAPMPQLLDQLVVVLQGLDMFTPVEQGIEVPTITLQDGILQRAVLREPLVEQLVEVPLPETVILQRGRSAAGITWCHVAARGGSVLLVDGWLSPRPVAPPEGFTASPGRFSNTGRGGEAGGRATDPGADRGSGRSGW